ncbi:MAG: hypothetical protein Fur0020_10250 [Thermodesulfovibrionia bacterium]
MEILALLSKRDDIILDVKDSLKGYTLYPIKTVEELKELYNNIPISLIIIDTISHGLSSIEGILPQLEDVVLLITPEGLDKHTIGGEITVGNLPSSVYDCIGLGDIRAELLPMVERALKRQRFKDEIGLLRRSRGEHILGIQGHVKPDTGLVFGNHESFHIGKHSWGNAIVNFAKILTAGFDVQRLFNHFMDSVMEIARVSKMSIMLKEGDLFRVKAHRGIGSFIVENLKLGKDSALVAWLARHGGIMQKPVNPADPLTIDIKKEMDILQCSLSFPMIYRGELLGIFNINNKITNDPFYREEIEIIYLLCNYLIAGVKDIGIYHQMRYQNEFIKNMLSNMNSGVIAIDKEERITIFNQQAGKILNLEPSEMIGSYMRMLPSPLGDILHETMITQTSYRRQEVEIPPSGIQLGINSYVLLDEQQNPVGAGIVFADISDSKVFEEQLRREEGLKVVDKLMAKIAHEIRNPLTSIQTYTQLINEKYSNDAELRDFYTSSVSRSIQKLDTIIDRLITFSISQEFNLEKVNISTLIDEIEGYLAKNVKMGYSFIRDEIEPSLLINVDRKLLVKVVYYVITHIIDRVGFDHPIEIRVKTIMKGMPHLEIRMIFGGEEITDEEKGRLFRQLTEIDNLETELNIPISHKIVKGHNGRLDIISEGGKNLFIIDIPILDRRSGI